MPQRTMANLDYSYISTELQPLVGRFFDKFYELRTGVFRLKFGRDNIIIELGVRLHLTKYIEEAPEASNFTMKLRKELKGKKLSALSQHGKDRIIIFDFEGTQLIAEMFGEGNLALVRDGKILAVYSRKKWKGRELTARAEYAFPPSQTKSMEEIFNSVAPIGAALRDLNIGMDYARAILADAGIPDSKPTNSLSKEEKNSLESSYKKLMETLSPKVIYAEENKPAGFSLFGEGKEFPTLSEALDEYYGIPTPQEEAEEKKGKTEEKERLLRMLETQEKRFEELKKESEEEKKSGDFIYENFEEIQKIIDLYKKGGMNSIEELANKKGWKLNKEKRELEIL